MGQYRTGRIFLTLASPTVYGDILTNWSGIPAGSWLAVPSSNVTHNVASVTLRAYTYFPAYSAGTTYAASVLVRDGVKIWASLQDTNIAHTPESNPSWWRECSGWQATLTAPWATASRPYSAYGFVTDFTDVYGLPLVSPGDLEVPAILSRALTQLDILIQTGGGSPNLAGLTDVQLASLGDKDTLQYDTATSKWLNSPQTNLVDGGNF